MVKEMSTHLSTTFVKKKVAQLGNSLMTSFSQGYQNGTETTIFASAKQNSMAYTFYSKRHPAVALIDVILAANRDYNKQVDKHVKRLREEYPNMTFTELNKLIHQHS